MDTACVHRPDAANLAEGAFVGEQHVADGLQVELSDRIALEVREVEPGSPGVESCPECRVRIALIDRLQVVALDYVELLVVGREVDGRPATQL